MFYFPKSPQNIFGKSLRLLKNEKYKRREFFSYSGHVDGLKHLQRRAGVLLLSKNLVKSHGINSVFNNLLI